MTGTSTSSAVKAEITASSFHEDDGMVTVSYTRSAMDPNKWEPVRITIDEFRNRYGRTGKITKKRVSFEGDMMDKPVLVKVRLTPEEEDFINRVEKWAATHKKLSDWVESDEFEDDSREDKKRFDKTATEKAIKTGTELATGNYENRLAKVKNLPKLPTTEHLTGVDNYDGWNTKMRRFFAAFDVTEYVEKPLAEIRDIDKIKNQLDAAILLAIHGNISTDLQQVVNNEVHTNEAWETLRKLYTGNTVQELINIGTKLLELAFNQATPVPTFFAEAEAGFLKLHRIGYTVPERIKTTFLLQKIYPRLPATAASITALPDEQIKVRYIQEKVIKAVDLMAHNRGELGETGDPRPTGGNSNQRLAIGYDRRPAITDGSSKGRRYTAGTSRGMTGKRRR